MKEDYLVTTSVGTRSRKLVWTTSEPIALDHPECWVLEKTSRGIEARDTSETLQPGEPAHAIVISEEAIAQGAAVELPPPAKGGPRSKTITIQLAPLTPIRAAYMPLEGNNARKLTMRPSQLIMFTGVRRYVSGYRRFGEGYRGYVEGVPVFNLFRAGEGYQITALKTGLEMELPSQSDPVSLREGVPAFFNDEELTRAAIFWGNHWWRLNRIAIPEPLPMLITEEEHVQEERALMHKIARFVSIGFAVMWMVAMLLSKINAEKEKLTPPQQIELKQPKLLPPKPEEPKPKPPEPKPEPPKPKPKPKPEPKPKAKPRPVKKAQAPKPRPHPVKLPPPPPRPAARPTPPKPTAPPPPSAAQIKAAENQQLAKSLNFLSPSLNKPSANINEIASSAKSKKYGAVTSGANLGKNALKNFGNHDISDGPIDTKAARNIDGSVALKGGRGKALNAVQGKVSINGLYAEGGGDLSGALTSSGLTVSGEGSIPESLLLKVLSKYLEKFQYCYEKALLTDASLAGNVMMQWTIEPSGSATAVKVVRTQINNAGFEHCMAEQITKIHFPSPKGGSVTVKYPFAFSSSSL